MNLQQDYTSMEGRFTIERLFIIFPTEVTFWLKGFKFYLKGWVGKITETNLQHTLPPSLYMVNWYLVFALWGQNINEWECFQLQPPLPPPPSSQAGGWWETNTWSFLLFHHLLYHSTSISLQVNYLKLRWTELFWFSYPINEVSFSKKKKKCDILPAVWSPGSVMVEITPDSVWP